MTKPSASMLARRRRCAASRRPPSPPSSRVACSSRGRRAGPSAGSRPSGESADLGVRPRDAHRAELDPVGRHGGGEPAVLGLAVDLAHVDAERQVPADQLGGDGRRAGGGAARAVQAQRALDVVEHEEVGDADGAARSASRRPPARRGGARPSRMPTPIAQR